MRDFGYMNHYCTKCLKTTRFKDTGNFLRCTAVGCTRKYSKKARLNRARRRRHDP